jgi:hypothetical protein
VSGRLRPVAWTAASVFLLGLAPRADAQAPTIAPRAEIGLAVVGALPVSLGVSDAAFTRPDGRPLVVYRTHNRLAPGAGVEGRLGYRVSRRVSIEAAGAWTALNVESRLTDDVEEASPAIAAARLSRFTAEGAALVDISRGSRSAVFARGGAGWWRELTRGIAVIDDAAFVSAGLGVKYWWGSQSARRGRRVALRLDARAVARSGRPFLADRHRRILPVVMAGLSLGL